MLEQSPKYLRLVVRPVAFDHPFATDFAHAGEGGVIRSHRSRQCVGQ